MTIAILSTTHGRGRGAEAVLEELLRVWGAARPPLLVAAPPDSGVFRAAREAGCAVAPLATGRDAALRNRLALGAVRRAAAGCARVHAWHGRGFELARTLARRLGVPASGTQHDHPAAAYHSRLRRWLMRRSANRFEALACVSRAVADACAAAGYRAPLRVIYNGLAAAAPPARPAAELPDGVRIGFAGLYAVGKGFAVVADWAHATRQRPGWHWRLYGEPAPALADAARRLAAECPGTVALCGRRPAEELLAEVDLLAAPATQFDSLPTLLLEAARAGVPCVAAANGGAAEIVRDGQTGFLFDPARPQDGLRRLETLAQNPGLRRQMGAAAAQDFDRRFRAERMAEDYARFWSQA